MKASKFYCENCGAEVRHNTKVCPKCGRFFSAVRCPKCAFTGDASLFRQGCPSCGYAGSLGDSPSDAEEFSVVQELGGSGKGWSAGKRRQSPSAPAWVYWLAMGILGATFALLVLIYLNM